MAGRSTLKLGRGVRRAAVERAFSGRSRPDTFTYQGVLQAADVREAVAGIQAAGSPRWAQPLLAWFASHPSTPVAVLRRLYADGGREVLLSLAMNRRLPAELKKALLAHPDAEVREHASHVFSKLRRH